ncbi:MAG: T9SS type A sorting domain-containing protein [Cytophagaceae bacterium]|jgi:hypothetical protein|nr:T9SS type A sorting domain-containing protein [Cytophagaceae bacterium]
MWFRFIALFFGWATLFAQYVPQLAPIQHEREVSSPPLRVASLMDTIRLPFFDDFTGYDRLIDSVVVSTGNPVRLHARLLDTLGLSATVFITLPKSISPSVSAQYPIFGTVHLQRESAGVYLLDTSSATFNTALSLNEDTVMYQVHWSEVNKAYDQLDSYRWETSQVSINNRFAIGQPSYNVATFDGLRSNGSPYSNVATTVGETDVLTSRPINLQWKNPSAASPADSIYLSFFYQNKGYGGEADNSDYLSVQFLDSTANWQTVWTMFGTSMASIDTFRLANIVVKDSIFFHKGFRFRIKSYGRQSGTYDVWNVDYIYLDKNRSQTYVALEDWSLGEVGNTFLRHFSSVPFRHFLPNKVAQSDSILYRVYNLSQFPLANVIVYGSASDNLGNTIDSKVVSAIFSNDPTFEQVRTFDPTVANITTPMDPRLITHGLSISTKDSVITFLHANNQFSTQTVLYNYYAYDDNSAEAGLGFQLIGAKQGNEYQFLQSDTITHIDFKFVRTKGPDMSGRSIIMKIWDKDYQEVRSQVIAVNYNNNNFVRYALASPLPVQAGEKYYLGYQQNFSDFLTIGFDRNTKRSDKIFYFDGATFQRYSDRSDSDSGALMIRPVFYKPGEELVPVIDPVFLPDFAVFPIPADEEIYIVGNIASFEILSLMGASLAQGTLIPYQENRIDVSSLPPGIYLLRSESVVKRIIIR